MATHTRARPAQQGEAARLERDLAWKAIKVNDQATARKHLHNVLDRLISQLDHPESANLYISTTLELSNLCFVLGQGFGELLMPLQSALNAAKCMGDRRSQALINLHLGRLYYFAERRSDAIRAFSEGKEEIEDLADDDILTQAGEFLGLYFHMQGLFREAQKHFEQGVESFESGKEGLLVNPSAAMWLSYCAAYLGQFHQAIGSLDYHRRLALEKSDQTLATTLRAVLGLVLLMIKKTREAAFELSGAMREATQSKNDLALYFCRGGRAYLHLLKGRPHEARDWLALTMSEGAGSGLIRQYASPFVLEMLFEFERLGLEPIPEFRFQREVHRLMSEPNIHLHGVALRLKAMEASARGEDKGVIQSDLASSEHYLKRSGDPVQLAKTRVELARYNLGMGDQNKARILAQKAWRGFSGYANVFYPDDLRHLLTVRSDVSPDYESREEFVHLFMDLIQDLVPSTDLNKLLTRTVAATNRFFGAERGGVFWFSRRKPQKGPALRAACNLFQADVNTKEFRSSLALVFEAHRKNMPQVDFVEDGGCRPNRAKAVLCLPFEVQGLVQGVLYHDNSFVKACFDHFGKSQLVRISQSITGYIEHVIGFSRRIEQKVIADLGQLGQADAPEIVTQSSIMRKMLGQTDRIAASDSTVLILGETGVGKELLAQRLHRLSLRKKEPFVIVDPTTIPESLIESELFGHEKGAFTGADRQKTGRMELANHGTLFIDEVGEIPKSVQVKLLRVLQEKTLIRIGGTKTIFSDFRLLAATNRDLAEEVAAGRFREDLYYRINVIPITIPSLRERIEDVPLLAYHFLQRYASKYSRSALRLMPQDEVRLAEYHWPGNVRELQNVMERAVLLSTDERLELNLPTMPNTISKHPFADNPTLDELQRRYILHVLDKTDGKIGGPHGAADLLGMKRSSLYNRMRRLGLR